MKKLLINLFVISLAVAGQQMVLAKGVNFNMLAATPQGSWQLREDVTTNPKGKQTVSTMRTSMLGSEERNGEKHYWVEMAIDSYKVNRKGDRKKAGDRTIMKSLIPASTFSADPANVIGNLRAFGVEMIVQNGNDDPMRMKGTGGMMAGIMKAMQTEIAYNFEQLGSETVAVKAGEFGAEKIQGTGTVDMKIIFKKIHVESDSTMWLSDKVPFGTIKIAGSSVTNGKKSTNSGELLEYGMTGAVSEITKQPVDMPEMPKLFGN